MKLKVFLGIGIALICVGLVLSGTGCQPRVEPVKIDTKEEVILMATDWARTTDCSDLVAKSSKITVTCLDGNTSLWQVSYYSTAQLIEDVTFTPRTITYLDVIVSLYIENGIIKRYGYYICALPQDFGLCANYVDFLQRAYRSGKSGYEDF